MDPQVASLVELHYRRAHNYGRYLFPYEDDSGSAAVEALIHIARDWVRLEPGEHFWPWATNALRWRLTDWWRTRYGREVNSARRNLFQERSLPDQIRQKASDECVETTVLSSVFVEEMNQLLPEVLTDRELSIIRLRLEEHTLKHIGETYLGVTESRVCQILGDVRKKVTKAMNDVGS